MQNCPQIIGWKCEAFWTDAVCCGAQICDDLTKHRRAFGRGPSDGSLGKEPSNAGLLDQIGPIPLWCFLILLTSMREEQTRQFDLNPKNTNLWVS